MRVCVGVGKRERDRQKSFEMDREINRLLETKGGSKEKKNIA